MKIKSVKIEGFHNVVNKTYEFDNLNYIKGPNGAGKSTVLQAIQLALLGYIPGTDKNKTAIFRHAGNHTMAVTLCLDDNGNDVMIRRIWSGGSSITSSVEVDPATYSIEGIVSDLELPIFNFNEFVDMTANKLKDWFISFLPSTDVSVDWEVVLRNACKGDSAESITDYDIKSYSDAIKQFGLKGIDEIRKANEYFKSVQSAKKAELQRLENTIQSLVYYDDFDGYAMSVDEVVAEISKCEDRERAAIQLKSAKDSNARIESQLMAYSTLSDSIEDDERVKHLYQLIEDITKQVSEYEKAVEALQTALLECQADMQTSDRILKSEGKCPFTFEECPTMVDAIVAGKQAYDAEKARFDEMYAERNDTQSTISRLNGELRQYTAELKELEGMYRSRDSLKASLVPVEGGDTDVVGWRAKVDKFRDTLIKLRSNAQYQTMIDQLTSDKFKIEQELVAYKAWIDLTGVNGLQSTLSSPFVSLGEAMNEFITKFFGDTTSAEFDIQAKANSFSFGITRDGKYIPFNLLSSGEKCLYTFALMLTLVKDAKCPLKLVLVDDLVDHLDNEHADSLFKSLLKVKDIQIIVAGVKDLGLSKGNANLNDKVNTLNVEK